MKIVNLFSKILKFFLIYHIVLISCLYADTIKLKNGKTLNGKFISENQEEVTFDTFEEKIKIDKTTIQSIELGYSGIPVCYKLSYKPVENCDDQLYSFTKDEIIFIVDNGADIKKYKPIGVSLIKLSRSGAGSEILTRLPNGIKIRIVKTSKEEVEGKIRSISPNQVQLSKKNGESAKVSVGEIQTVYWESGGVLTKTADVLKYTIPGFVQFKYNKPKSLSLMGLWLLFAIAIPIEYNAAQKALDNNVNIIPVGDYFMVVNNALPSNNFQFHRNRMNIAIAGLSVVTAYHFYDVIFNSEDEDSISIQLMRNPIFTQNNFLIESKEIEFKYTHRF